MISRNILVFRTATLVACITSVLAQSLPYNPTYLVQGPNSKVYQFSPDASLQFAVYDVTNTLSSDDNADPLTTQLPFLSDTSNSFIPVVTKNGITVFSGECAKGEQELDLWTYGFSTNNTTWTQVHTTSQDPDLSANFLAAGFAFPGALAQDVDDLYVFGGMCPDGDANNSAWTTDATYSNTLLAISPEGGADFEVSLTGTRSPPIAEAGLTITPLLPTSFNSDNTAAQQNFVLLGGHTENAFINMSQVAMFSMPEQAWAFLAIQQPNDTPVEPRSGHTAVISEDGSRIVVFGGWVGDVTNPANPQLAVLEVGQGYGGNGSWTWVVPGANEQYLDGAAGVYGHGAVMLPGDIMMITSGYPITGGSSGQRKRASTKTMFYDTKSSSWSNHYVNPNTEEAKKSKSGLSSHEKTGLGAGLGVGIAALLVLAAVWFFYARRKRKERRIREQHLRELALGTNDAFSTTGVSRPGSRGASTAYRSASWGARQEERIEGDGPYYDTMHYENDPPTEDGMPPNKRGMLNVPGPNSNLRNSLRTRGLPGFGSSASNGLAALQGVYTIEEVEERSERGSVRRRRSVENRPLSDPFKDPPALLTNAAADKRKQEVQTWVDDWQEAADSMTVSRTGSKTNSRTYSNLSAYHSASSGDKSSDRTNSDLSERSNISNMSFQRLGTVSRAVSQRTAGYNLFSSAASAMGRITGRSESSALERSASKRSVSHGDLAQMGVRKRSNSIEQSNQPRPNLPTPRSREELTAAGQFFTPPESPIKDYKNHSRRRSNSFTSPSNSLTSHSKKALGVLGHGAKRILTGTNAVNVVARVGSIEKRDRSPTKDSEMPEMAEVPPRAVSGSNTVFWKHKQGAKDWDEPGAEGSGTVRRRSGRPQPETEGEDLRRNEDDWDVEAAVNQRVVQVMFTVPKERLRVVNADNLSLISRTDTNASRDSNRSARSDEGKMDPKRMSRVVEDGEDDSTLVGSSQLAKTSLYPSSVEGFKGKERVVDRADRDASGGTIGKAL